MRFARYTVFLLMQLLFISCGYEDTQANYIKRDTGNQSCGVSVTNLQGQIRESYTVNGKDVTKAKYFNLCGNADQNNIASANSQDLADYQDASAGGNVTNPPVGFQPPAGFGPPAGFPPMGGMPKFGGAKPIPGSGAHNCSRNFNTINGSTTSSYKVNGSPVSEQEFYRKCK